MSCSSVGGSGVSSTSMSLPPLSPLPSFVSSWLLVQLSSPSDSATVAFRRVWQGSDSARSAGSLLLLLVAVIQPVLGCWLYSTAGTLSSSGPALLAARSSVPSPCAHHSPPFTRLGSRRRSRFLQGLRSLVTCCRRRVMLPRHGTRPRRAGYLVRRYSVLMTSPFSFSTCPTLVIPLAAASITANVAHTHGHASPGAFCRAARRVARRRLRVWLRRRCRRRRCRWRRCPRRLGSRLRGRWAARAVTPRRLDVL